MVLLVICSASNGVRFIYSIKLSGLLLNKNAIIVYIISVISEREVDFVKNTSKYVAPK